MRISWLLSGEVDIVIIGWEYAQLEDDL